MAEGLLDNSIERLSRAILAQLTPLTGERAEGVVRATGLGAEVVVPANTYLVATVRGHKREDLLYKTAGDWTIPAVPGAFVDLPIVSNVGGHRHNQPNGTTFRFEPPIPGLEPTGTAIGAIAGGSNDGQLVKSVAIFEEIDSGNEQEDFFDSMLIDYPGVIVSWLTSEPAEGAQAGLRRGSTRGSRSVSFYRESFVLYVIVGRLASLGARRAEGQVIMQAATRLLSDRMQNDDGEQLSTVGAGVEIESRARLIRREKHYVYGVRLRTNQTAEARVDGREFAKWTKTRIQGAVPGREAPEPTTPLVIVDDTEEMP